MKVLHICSSNSGGAGIAAYRLHKALLDTGVHSRMLCLHKSGNDKTVIQYFPSLFARMISHTGLPYRQNKYNKFINDAINRYESITFPESIFDISSHPLVKEADVINLHWIGGILNYPAFFKNTQKPIIWTLHDMNPFLGFAHYQGDVDNNIQDSQFEKKVARLKQKSYKNADISIVNLNSWMKYISSNSQAFNSCKHHIVPNSININIFKHRDKLEAKNILEIPKDKQSILFCSQHVNNKRKGFDLLLDAINLIKSNCHFIIVGDCDKNLLKSNNVTYLGTLKDELLLSLVYSAADIFILPSREDNLPNTMVESLCCGTPVISFTNGGMKDIINTGFNGILVEQQTGEALASAIQVALNIDFNSVQISEDAHKMFNPTLQATEYIKIYQNALISYRSPNKQSFYQKW